MIAVFRRFCRAGLLELATTATFHPLNASAIGLHFASEDALWQRQVVHCRQVVLRVAPEAFLRQVTLLNGACNAAILLIRTITWDQEQECATPPAVTLKDIQ